MLPRSPTAVFVVRGSQPVTVEVRGVFDACAAVGFHALVPWLVGDRQVTFDLRGCQSMDETAAQEVGAAVGRIEAAGGIALVAPPAPPGRSAVSEDPVPT